MTSSKHSKGIRKAIFLPALAALLPGLGPNPATAQPVQEFAPLFRDDPTLDWHLESADPESFSWSDGVLSISGDEGWLRSPRQYEDFILRFQVRFMEEDADSGVFVRAGLDTPFIRGWPGDSYQIQLRDISANTSDRPLPLGHVYRLQVPEGETEYRRDRVLELYNGVGEWHDMEISVLGGQIEVTLEGEDITIAQDIANDIGYLGFQSETGSLQLRDIQIREL